MRTGIEEFPRKVAQEIHSIVNELVENGWQISFARYDRKSFGNWYVDLVRLGFEIRIVKDRSQYFVSGPSKNDLQRVGLGGSFDDIGEFRRTLIAWATNPPLA